MLAIADATVGTERVREIWSVGPAGQGEGVDGWKRKEMGEKIKEKRKVRREEMVVGDD